MDPPRYPDTRTPRWVKVFGMIALVLILLFVALHLAGYGFGNHMHHTQG
jgi:hypothetical protein